MDQAKKDEMREIIQKKLEETKTEIAQLKELTKPIKPDNAYGRLSRMDAINNKTINDAALRKQKKQLQKLERALVKIEKGNYGTCLKCGKDIPLGRLKFMPWTTKCVKCA
ncbi:TraR/DksA family transcriptional regulator [Fodinibius sp.]|uniref:TraR/DksA family transcriptional regulator n=1 Tax=Fodinibius sp. TaxID=1872440 RepID=UPI00356B4458